MKQDYKTVNTLTLNQKKNYLLGIDYHREMHEAIYDCMNEKQFNQFITNKQNNKKLFIAGLKQLYNSQNFDDLEYQLIMMNAMFYYKNYEEIKKELFHKICKKTISIHEYCVLRQLVPFQKNNFSKFVSSLHHHFGVDKEECARICLLEDEHHLAFEYLKALDDCQDENLLNLLSSYSLYEYTALIRNYARKKKGYALIPSH